MTPNLSPSEHSGDRKIESWLSYVAQSQYFARPNDEKYNSLESFRDTCAADKARTAVAYAQAGDLTFEPHGTNAIALRGSTGSLAVPTNYAFGHVCGMLGAPRTYMQTLPADLASQCLNYSLRKMEDETRRQRHMLYMQKPDGDGQPYRLRALTSTDYRRVYDATLAEISLHLRDRYHLDLPPVWEGGQGGAYRSDRDSFLLLCSGGSIVTDPTVGRNDDGRMYRGVILRNSETGHSTLSFTCFLYRVVCGNHAIWNPRNVHHFNRRHVGRNFVHDFETAIGRALHWLDTPESTDVETIRRLAEHKIADSREDLIATARKIAPSLTQTHIDHALQAAQAFEACDPLSVWGFTNGLTRISQQTPYMDARHAIDLSAQLIVKKYAYA